MAWPGSPPSGSYHWGSGLFKAGSCGARTMCPWPHDLMPENPGPNAPCKESLWGNHISRQGRKGSRTLPTQTCSKNQVKSCGGSQKPKRKILSQTTPIATDERNPPRERESALIRGWYRINKAVTGFQLRCTRIWTRLLNNCLWILLCG